MLPRVVRSSNALKNAKSSAASVSTGIGIITGTVTVTAMAGMVIAEDTAMVFINNLVAIKCPRKW